MRETYRSTLVVQHPGLPVGKSATRNAATSIYFLLAAPDFSALHHVGDHAARLLSLHVPPTGCNPANVPAGLPGSKGDAREAGLPVGPRVKSV